MKCVSVLANGDVTINWVSPANTCSSFHGYYIYASKSKNGPYVIIDSVLTLGQNNYTHTGAGAGINPWYYYIRSKYDCAGNPYPPGDTIASIKVDVINNNSGAAQVSWNRPFSVKKPTSSSDYFLIYREYPAGKWILIDSTKSNVYKDTIISICTNQQFNYQIKVRDSTGCFTESSVFGGIFKDVLPPIVPDLDTVSVNIFSGFIGLGWNVNPSIDTKAYVIYSYINGIWTPADTVLGRYNTYFAGTTPAYDGVSGSKIFKVAAMDSCGNISPAILIYNSIFLTSTFDECSRTAKLNWNKYSNIKSGVLHYAVYYTENGGTPILAGKTTNTSFLHTNLKNGITYCYFVRAYNVDLNKTSSSNAVCIFNSGTPPPDFLYLKSASVIEHNEVKIEIYTDTSVNIAGYRIRRSDNPNGPFTEVGKIPFSKNPMIDFYDHTAVTNKEEYYYVVSAFDKCGFNILNSNHARLIRTKAISNQDFTNTIRWSDYEIWSGLTESYSVYRSVNGIWDSNPIAILPPTVNTYTDSAILKIAEGDNYCYKIKAEEGMGNIYSFNANSFSDSSCVSRVLSLYIPNAFVPGGINAVFKPVAAFSDGKYYKMLIFNKWGGHIFTSEQAETGWDGTIEGDPAPQGVYSYIIQMKGVSGTTLEKRGTVLLIR